MLSDRAPQLTDKQLEWAARKRAGAALTAEDSLLDIEIGNLKRFHDNGVEKTIVAPKKWARAIPIARGLVIVTYTRVQMLLLADGFAVNCPLVRIHRAETQSGGRQLLVFARRESPLAIAEIETASSGHRSADFVGRMAAIRDQERAGLPAEARAQLERIDVVVHRYSIEELWARPSAPITMEPSEAALLAGPATRINPGDGLDDLAWSRLRVILEAAARKDAAGYAEAGLWQPPGFGLAGQQRTGLYLFYLLGFRVKEVLLTQKPTPEQLHDLAVTIYPGLRAILDRADQAHLEETLRTAFDLPPAGTGVSLGEFAVFAAAAVGLLSDEPDQDLARIRPRLASWWNRNYESFVTQGLTE